MTLKIGITKNFTFEDTKQTSQNSMVEVKKVTYGEALLTQQQFILGIWSLFKVFTDFQYLLVNLAFVKILSIREESQQVNYHITYIVIAHVRKIYFCKYEDGCLLKSAEQNFQKKPVITLIFKLKALVTCTKFDLGSGDILI